MFGVTAWRDVRKAAIADFKSGGETCGHSADFVVIARGLVPFMGVSCQYGLRRNPVSCQSRVGHLECRVLGVTICTIR